MGAALNGEIISADSRQVYRGMDLGTGKDYEDYIINGLKIPRITSYNVCYTKLLRNDDRLLIRVSEDGKVQFYNTQMPYYKSVPSGVELSKFFLIKQSIDNYIKPLSVLEGALKILGNCMQHQYDKKQVSGP